MGERKESKYMWTNTMLSLLSVSTSNRKEIHMDDFNQDNLETFEEYLFSKSFLEQDDDIDISNIRQLSSITQELINKLEMEVNND